MKDGILVVGACLVILAGICAAPAAVLYSILWVVSQFHAESSPTTWREVVIIGLLCVVLLVPRRRP